MEVKTWRRFFVRVPKSTRRGLDFAIAAHSSGAPSALSPRVSPIRPSRRAATSDESKHLNARWADQGSERDIERREEINLMRFGGDGQVV